MTKQVWAVLGVVLAVGLALGPAVAFAQDAKVKVQVEVVLASNKGTAVEPPELNKMKEAFQKQNFSFTSFKRMSLDVVEVGAQKPTEVKLPNGTNASLQLLGMKEGIATLRVIIPNQSSVEVELGRQGAVYQKAGKHVGGDLILVLVPPSK
ncbi:hypothetical protein OV208_02550 [Corallococcus sp. bb12-1]|uniref:hypothetical protein n=1 Tax=Corallococcus sp. bb12-1 TaxID=2996784 RepID=UPI00226DA736|nr:hypothetical protein [Corallococcus sp. bb12-1]MCY1040187.1 hypothetical protein [Corallococcus sp. bb12-1]